MCSFACSSCVCVGFPPGSLVSSHLPKIMQVGRLAMLNCPLMWMSVLMCVYMDWCHSCDRPIMLQQCKPDRFGEMSPGLMNLEGRVRIWSRQHECLFLTMFLPLQATVYPTYNVPHHKYPWTSWWVNCIYPTSSSHCVCFSLLATSSGVSPASLAREKCIRALVFLCKTNKRRKCPWLFMQGQLRYTTVPLKTITPVLSILAWTQILDLTHGDRRFAPK